VTESEQINLARRGDESAWEALVRVHQEPVFRLAYLLLGDPDDAQDVVQETFVRAYYSLSRFDTDRPLRPWLLRITSNLAHNRRRAFGRYFAALMRYARSDPESISPVAAPAQHTDAGQLWQVIQRLAPPFREAIYLRYYLEMSDAEIAATLSVAPGTVKSRLHRALSRLREMIDRDYPDLKDAFGS
jgi:RNA polymerase sigma-70 factor, ECF subfamily